MIRPEALEWWRSLTLDAKIMYAERHIPDMPFMAVNSSSCMINRIADAVEKAKKKDTITDHTGTTYETTPGYLPKVPHGTICFIKPPTRKGEFK
jgi:hypothetical protein